MDEYVAVYNEELTNHLYPGRPYLRYYSAGEENVWSVDILLAFDQTTGELSYFEGPNMSTSLPEDGGDFVTVIDFVY